MVVSFKGAHFPKDIILMGVCWYVAYLLSTRHVEELMLERGVHVHHSTINQWVSKYSPQLEEAFHRRKRPVWISWRMDETFYEAVVVKPFFSVCFAYTHASLRYHPSLNCVYGCSPTYAYAICASGVAPVPQRLLSRNLPRKLLGTSWATLCADGFARRGA